MIFIKKINFVVLFIFLFWNVHLLAQSGDNPFEIQYRADKKEKRTDLSDVVEEKDLAKENPFNVIRTPQKINPSSTSLESPISKKKSKTSVEVDDTNFMFGLTLAMLILLTLLTTFYRSQLTRAYRAFTNENVMRMLHREKGTATFVPYYILYVLFLLNAGVFVYLMIRHNNVLTEVSNMQLLGYAVGGVTLVYFLKHIVIGILGSVFPIEKEASLYNMTITIFGIILSIVFFVSNIIIAYAPPNILPYFLYFSFFLIGSIYLFRAIRGLSISNVDCARL